ncbi:MAG TPA: thioredoxin family protein [Methanoregulaceae archaeon]|nr:thioredoxin family protein [Methanoregulaceae archaeon]HQJ88373.1 thioredoxin family protein [Methanoregulaceae archaeon]
MTKIEVLGTGCAKCKRLYANVQEAVKSLGMEAEVFKVDSLDELIERGVMSTPALYIDGTLRLSGRVATVDELIRMLRG